jgi:hypothetical protein
VSAIGRHHIEGSPTSEEEAAVIAALERIIRDEHERTRPSAWKLAGRIASLRSRTPFRPVPPAVAEGADGVAAKDIDTV